jgi:hypothetical protein
MFHLHLFQNCAIILVDFNKKGVAVLLQRTAIFNKWQRKTTMEMKV